jgi:hypothetical protein
MPRFVVLRHESPRGIHFDFMLEAGDVLKTWALPQPPQPGLEMECKALADHRLAYLDYEGPISGDRGLVCCWDRGTYRIVEQSDAQWVLELAGEKLAGTATFCRPTDAAQRWSFSFHERYRA